MRKYVRPKNRFRRKANPRLKKRWYFNAGANLPFLGRTSVAFGTSKSKRSIINTVRRGLEDPMHKLWSAQGVSTPSSAVLQDTIYTINLTGNIPQGDTTFSRNGDNIHLDALKMRILFNNAAAVNKAVPKHFRIMVVKSDIDAQGASDAWASGSLGASDLFQGNNTPCFEHPNPKNVSVIYDKIVKFKPAISATNEAMEFSEILRLGSTFTYKTGTNYGKLHNLYLVCTGYEPGATTGTTQIGNVYFFGDLIFKDSK